MLVSEFNLIDKFFVYKILSAPVNSYPDPTLWLDRLAATFR